MLKNRTENRKRYVCDRFPVSVHGQKGYSCSRPPSSSSTKIKLEGVPVEIKDQKSVFGYIIDKEMLVNCYSKKHGIQEFSEPKHYFDTLTKRDLARDAADEAGCSVFTVSRKSRKDPSEEIVFAYFASYKPPYISTTTLPTEDQLQKFKDYLLL